MSGWVTAVVVGAAAIYGGVATADANRRQRHAVGDQKRDAARLAQQQAAIPVADSVAIDAARRRDRIRRQPNTGRTSTILTEQLGG